MSNEKNNVVSFAFSVFCADDTGIIVEVYDLPFKIAKNWVKNYYVPTFHPELIGCEIYYLPDYKFT